MCITMHPARLTGTKLYAGEAMRGDRYVHVLAYSNSAKNTHSGPNAMILPLPAKNFTQENAIDTRAFKGFLDSILEATKPLTFAEGNDARSRGVSKALVFDVGGYTVVTSTDARSIGEALDQVPANRRPELNQDVLDSFAVNYPGWPIAVCCWDGSLKAEPLLFWYEPLDPTILFAPALDSHGGEGPTQGEVDIDHIISFGSTINPLGPREVKYPSGIPSEVAALLPPKAVGQKFKGKLGNGDFYFNPAHFLEEDKGREGAPEYGSSTPERGDWYHPRGKAWRWFPNKTESAVSMPLGIGW